VDERQLSPEIREKIYRPEAGEDKYVEIEFPGKDESFGKRSEAVNVELDATE
jgi:hypothetical protein